MGDWQHFRDAYDGFPAVSVAYSDISALVAGAISDAITGAAGLAEALARAEAACNAKLVLVS